MIPSLAPSEVLSHSPLNPTYFGVLDGMVDDGNGGEVPAVDVPGNTVYNAVLGSEVLFNRIVLDQSDPVRVKLALIYYTLARLYGILADEKALFVGLVTQRGGQVSTPLGSHAELMRAAERNYKEAQNLFPDVEWPPLNFDISGGVVSPTRTYYRGP